MNLAKNVLTKGGRIMKVWAYMTTYCNEYSAECFAGTDEFDIRNIRTNFVATEAEAKNNLVKILPENTEIIWFDCAKDLREGDFVTFDHFHYLFSSYVGDKARIISWYERKVILVDPAKLFMICPKRLW